jgi:hypothetical protein
VAISDAPAGATYRYRTTATRSRSSWGATRTAVSWSYRCRRSCSGIELGEIAKLVIAAQERVDHANTMGG